jgi:uncharacterized membrane protein
LTVKRYLLPTCLLIALLQLGFVLFGTTGLVRTTLGLLLVAFLPGYTLLAALYKPTAFRFGALEHVVLALPISLALSALLGLVLHSVGLGVSASIQVITLSSFVTVTTTIALWRELHRPSPSRATTSEAMLYFGMMILCAFALGLTVLLRNA